MGNLVVRVSTPPHRVSWTHPWRSTDTATFFYVTPQNHFVVRQLRLLPRIPLQPLDVQSHESGLSHLPSIPLPNPFKAMKTRSIEHLPLTQRKRDLGRIVLDEEHDVGELLTNGSLLGLRTRNVGGTLRGLAWSDQQLTVSVPVTQTTCIELSV
jgi:hypothetical protein